MKTVDVEAEKREIDRLTDEAFAAEDRKDLEKMLESLADDVILQVPGMPQIQGIRALREFYKAFLPTFDSMKGGPRHIEVSSSGDMAWQYGSFSTGYKKPEGTIMEKGKYLAIWKKVDGKWKWAAYSVTSDEPAT